MVNLELKPIGPPMDRFPVVEKTLELIDTVGIESHRVVISSFHHPWLHEVKARTTAIAVQALVGWGNRETLDHQDLVFDVYNLSRQLAGKNRLKRLLGLGKRINVYTVNEASDMHRLIDAGVHGLFTDFPQRLVSLKGAGPE